MAPLLFRYYDEPDPGVFELIRELRFSNIRMVGKRPVPHAWEMEPKDKPGHLTAIVLEEIEFDEPIEDSVFSQQNLKRAEAAR
jgi:hypothetical protein